MAEVTTDGTPTDVMVNLTVELGRTRVTIDQLMRMGEGSLIELGVGSGEPAMVTINREAVAEGEVVVVRENFGVRITKMVNA